MIASTLFCDKSIIEIFVDVIVENMGEDIQEVLDLLSDNIGDEDE